MKVSKTKLSQLTPLAEGGFGKVYRVERFTLLGDTAPLAYKEFTAECDAQARSAEAAVAFRANLSPADQAELDFYCAWPRALVTDGRVKVCGLLMPLIPGEFFCELADDGGTMTSKPRDMGWLIASATQRRAARIDLGEVDSTLRLILLSQLVYAIGRLHKHGWVFGDLSFRNAVFTVDPPRIMLLDCDSAADLRDLGRRQSSTPFWDPPECPINPAPGQLRQQNLQDTVTDAYKLGLAILRCLTPGKGSSTARSSDRLDHELDPAGIQLVTRALSADRDVRPTAKELYTYLERLVSPLAAAPNVILAKLTTPFRSRCQDVRIEWRVDNADTIEISVGDGYRTVIDPVNYPSGVGFRADSAGSVSIKACNRFGSVSADLGKLIFFERSPLEASVSPLEVSVKCIPLSQINATEEYSLALSSLAEFPEVAILGEKLQIPHSFDIIE